MKSHFLLSVVLLAGCATVPVVERNTVRVHLYDIRLNNSSTGVDPKSVFVVAGNSVMPATHVSITLVPTTRKHYPDAGEEEYYIDVDLSVVSRFDLNKVFLFHCDLVGNKGMLRLRPGWSGRPTWDEITNEAEAAVRWKIFVKLSRQYRSLEEVPEHTRTFMKYYGWMDATKF